MCLAIWMRCVILKDKSHGDDDGALELWSTTISANAGWLARRFAAQLPPTSLDVHAVTQGLMLPNGIRLGHRALLQSYRKSRTPAWGSGEQEREPSILPSSCLQVLADGAEAGHALMNAYQDLQARVARREANMQRNMVLVRAAGN